MSHEAQFREALQAVGADESKWDYSLTKALSAMYTQRVDVEVYVFIDATVCLEYYDPDGYMQVEVRAADGNLTEAARFAENLRRALAGEPPLEVERLQKALDQALFFAEIRPDNYDDDTLYARSTFDQNPMLFRDSFPELAAELKRRAGEVQG